MSNVIDLHVKTAQGAINLGALRDNLPKLQESALRAKYAADDYREAVKFVAEQSGLMPAAVRAFVKARISEDAAKPAEKAHQLSMLFEEFGA